MTSRRSLGWLATTSITALAMVRCAVGAAPDRRPDGRPDRLSDTHRKSGRERDRLSRPHHCRPTATAAPTDTPAPTNSPSATATPSANATGTPAGCITRRSRSASGPIGIVAAEDAIWVATFYDGELVRIDPETMTVTDTVPVGDGAIGVAYAAGSLWVATHLTGELCASIPRRAR